MSAEQTANKNQPAIRFKGFSGEWRKCQIGEVTTFHKQGFYTTEKYGNAKKYYLLRGTDLNSNKLVIRDTPKIDASEKDYKDFKVEVGDVLLVRSGNVGAYGIVYEKVNAIFGSYLINFRFNKSSIVNEFFGGFYQSQLFYKQLRQITQQSANTNINAENIKSINISLTNLKEQTQIGECFQQLDRLIAQHQQKHDKLKQIKKALLEKMFPQQGARQPQIRFKGFTGDWEEKALGDVSESYSGGTPQVGVEEYYKGNIPFIRSAEINKISTELFISESGLKNSSARMVDIGCILYALYGATSGEVGLSKINGAINQAILAIQPNVGYSAQYIMQWLRKNKGSIIDTYLQGGQGNLSGAIVKSLFIKFPSPEEQTQIGNFFQQVDNLINQQQAQLTKLNNVKQALLTKMFV